MKRVTIIVPVYKAEKTIRRCVDSILAQDYRNIEIILVDDGSPDLCGEIIDSYQNSDERVKAIHKINGGVSAARNCGMEKATGEFIMFVDSDDSIDIKMISAMIININNEIDLVISGIKEIKKNSVKKFRLMEKNYKIEEFIEKMNIDYELIYVCGPCCKLYRRNIIEASFIKFDETISVGEDTIFVQQYIREIMGKIQTTNRVFYYYYRENSDSLFSKYDLNVYFAVEKSLSEIKKTLQKFHCSDDSMKRFNEMYYMQYVGNIIRGFVNYSCITNKERYFLIDRLLHDPLIISAAKLKRKDDLLGKMFKLLITAKAKHMMYLLLFIRYKLLLKEEL